MYIFFGNVHFQTDILYTKSNINNSLYVCMFVIHFVGWKSGSSKLGRVVEFHKAKVIRKIYRQRRYAIVELIENDG